MTDAYGDGLDDLGELRDIAEDVESKRVELFEALVDASNAARSPSVAAAGTTRAELQEYRNGLLDAYAILTGEQSEAIYNSIQDELQARHERWLAGQEP
jgi:hypothetical protein